MSKHRSKHRWHTAPIGSKPGGSRITFGGALVVATLTWSALLVWRLVTVNSHRPIDFLVYRGGAHTMLTGHGPYLAQFTSLHLPFTYPPFALLTFSALTILPLALTIVLWWLVNAVAIIAVCYLALGATLAMPRSLQLSISAALAGVSCLIFEPLRSTVGYGQINFIIMFLVTFDILRPSSKIRGLGIAVSSAIKLTPLAFVPGLFVDRDRRSAVRASVAFVVLSLVSSLILSSSAGTFWLHQALSPGHKGGVVGAVNQSEYSVVLRLLGDSTGSKVVWALLAAATLAIGYLTARSCFRRGRRLDALVILAVSELLASPISWSHHWSWIVLLPVLIWLRWRDDRMLALASSLVLLVAVTVPYHLHDWSWYQRGIARPAMGFTLVASGMILFAVIAMNEFAVRRASDHPVEDPQLSNFAQT